MPTKIGVTNLTRMRTMPLEVQVIRNNEPVSLDWHYETLSAIYTACIKEQNPDREYAPGKTFGSLETGQFIDFSMCPIYYLDMPKVPLVARGEQTLLESHVFEWMELMPGDRITARRVSK